MHACLHDAALAAQRALNYRQSERLPSRPYIGCLAISFTSVPSCSRTPRDKTLLADTNELVLHHAPRCLHVRDMRLVSPAARRWCDLKKGSPRFTQQTGRSLWPRLFKRFTLPEMLPSQGMCCATISWMIQFTSRHCFRAPH